jgi:hypothetical protein
MLKMVNMAILPTKKRSQFPIRNHQWPSIEDMLCTEAVPAKL